jgi:prepilin-type N-terminal cleavage/methylation domain-containing protein
MHYKIKTIQNDRCHGFSLPEVLTVVSIIGILAGAAIPNYLGQLCRSESSEAESTIGAVQAIVAAYIDETGVYPNTWDDLSSITAIMSNRGIAQGALSNPITLPNENYKLTVNGPTNTLYEMLAERAEGCENRNIRACLDVGTGASDLTRGDGNTDAQAPICS